MNQTKQNSNNNNNDKKLVIKSSGDCYSNLYLNRGQEIDIQIVVFLFDSQLSDLFFLLAIIDVMFFLSQNFLISILIVAVVDTIVNGHQIRSLIKDVLNDSDDYFWP